MPAGAARGSSCDPSFMELCRVHAERTRPRVSMKRCGVGWHVDWGKPPRRAHAAELELSR